MFGWLSRTWTRAFKGEYIEQGDVRLGRYPLPILKKELLIVATDPQVTEMEWLFEQHCPIIDLEVLSELCDHEHEVEGEVPTSPYGRGILCITSRNINRCRLALYMARALFQVGHPKVILIDPDFETADIQFWQAEAKALGVTHLHRYDYDADQTWRQLETIIL